MPSYIAQVSHLLRVFDNKVYCVPQSASTYINPVVATDISDTDELLKAYRYRLINCCQEGDSISWVPTNELGMLVFNSPCGSMEYTFSQDRRIIIRTDSFSRIENSQFPQESKRINKDEFLLVWDENALKREFSTAMVVLEFEALLWDDILLLNTVDSYSTTLQKYGCTVTLSKYDAWGFFVAPVQLPPATSFANCKVKSYNRKGIPSVSITSRRLRQVLCRLSIAEIAALSPRIASELYRTFSPWISQSHISSVAALDAKRIGGVVVCIECPLQALMLVSELQHQTKKVVLYDTDVTIRYIISNIISNYNISTEIFCHSQSSSRMGVDLGETEVVIVDEIGLLRDMLAMNPFSNIDIDDEEDACYAQSRWPSKQSVEMFFVQNTASLAQIRWPNVLRQIPSEVPILPHIGKTIKLVACDFETIATSCAGSNLLAVLAAYEGLVPQLSASSFVGAMKTNFDTDGAHWLCRSILVSSCERGGIETAPHIDRNILVVEPTVSFSSDLRDNFSAEQELSWGALYGFRLIDVTAVMALTCFRGECICERKSKSNIACDDMHQKWNEKLRKLMRGLCFERKGANQLIKYFSDDLNICEEDCDQQKFSWF